MTDLEKKTFTTIWIPTLVSFTDWVLKELQNKGIKRVYFLARDAYFNYLIAERIISIQGLNIECQYLEGSRFAWRTAENHLVDTDPLEKMCVGGVSVSFRSILRRGGLTVAEQEEIYSLLLENKLVDVDIDQKLNYSQVIGMKDKLRECGPLLEYVRKHADEAYDNTIGYFIQQGLFEDENFAIVDSGWVGSLQQTLNNLLNSYDRKKRTIVGYYFGLYELPKNIDNQEKQNYNTYYFRPYKDIERKSRFSNCLYEAVCSSPYGMVTGFNKQNGKYVSVRESEANLNVNRIKANRDLLIDILDKTDIKEHILTVSEIDSRLSKLMSNPTYEEACCYGDYKFSDDVFSTDVEVLAARLTTDELKRFHVIRRLLIMKGLIKEELVDSAWCEGSVALVMEEQPEKEFKHIKRYKRLVYLKKRIL